MGVPRGATGVLQSGESATPPTAGPCASTTFEALLREVERLGPAEAGWLSMPKQIAAVALYLQATSGLSEDVALQRAMGALGGRISTTPGGLKKASSEARAILQFGLSAPPAGAHPQALLRAIAAALAQVKVREVTKLRAAALGGRRGGRRAGPARRQVVAAVRTLIDLARTGHEAAQSELAELEDLIRDLSAAQSMADRLEATP